MKNYYEILNIPFNASLEAIKKAFRKQALQYHPDRNNSKDASQKFQEIYEAYEILSDNVKRQKYDKLYSVLFSDEIKEIKIEKDVQDFEEMVRETEKRSEQFSKMKYEDLEIYLRLIFKNIPDLMLTIFVFIVGVFMSIVPFTMEGLMPIILGLIIGVPLLIVSVRDFSLILKIKERKEKLKSIIIKT